MEQSSRRNHGGGIMEGEPWRMHHGGVIIEEAARRRQPGGGKQEEAAGRHQQTPRRRQKAPRRPPGDLCLCLYLCPFCYFYQVFLEARGACAQQGDVCEIRGDHKCIGWQCVIVKSNVCLHFFFFTFTKGF